MPSWPSLRMASLTEIRLIAASFSWARQRSLMNYLVTSTPLGKFVSNNELSPRRVYGFSRALKSSAKYSRGCFFLLMSSVMSILRVVLPWLARSTPSKSGSCLDRLNADLSASRSKSRSFRNWNSLRDFLSWRNETRGFSNFDLKDSVDVEAELAKSRT